MKTLIITQSESNDKDFDGLSRILCNYKEYLDSKNYDYRIFTMNNNISFRKKKGYLEIVKSYLFSLSPYISINKFVNKLELYRHMKDDIEWCNRIQIFGYCLELDYISYIKKMHTGIHISSILIDSLSLYRIRALINSFNLKKLPINIIELFKSFSYELVVRKLVKKISYVSYIDSNFVSRFLSRDTNVEVIPNGVDLKYYNPDKKTNSSKIRLLFYGDLIYKPNNECVNYITKSLHKTLKKLNNMPNYEIVLVGRTNEYEELNSKKGITATGYVKDLRRYYTNKTIFLCPMKTGAGVKNKVLEALAMEVPIICSKISADGIDRELYQFLFLANNKDEYIKNILEISNNYVASKTKISLGRKILENNHNWQSISKKYYQL